MSRSLPRPDRPPRAPEPGTTDEARRAVAARRAEASLAGRRGDETTLRVLLEDGEATVRAAAFAALVRLGAIGPTETAAALADPSPSVRRTACELATGLVAPDLAPLLDDHDPGVVEAACFAAGELGAASLCGRLEQIARDDADPLCREAAVAALGAIGDPAGLPAVLAALADIPAIRRRAVVALAAFEGPEVEAALRERLEDRDWQVRQAAEDVLGA